MFSFALVNKESVRIYNFLEVSCNDLIPVERDNSFKKVGKH